jgi:hypothetical protein
MFYIDFVKLFGTLHLLQVILKANVGIQGYLKVLILAFQRMVRRSVTIDGHPIQV